LPASQHQQQRVPGSSVASSPAACQLSSQTTLGHSNLQAVRSVRGPGMVFNVPVPPSGPTAAADAAVGIEPAVAQALSGNNTLL
jgi:hypothetical protein